MQQVFLSYTYNPHPDHAAESETLKRQTTTVIESMDLHVSDGEDVGGEQLNDAVRQRIDAADALIALVTPWRDAAGNKVAPPWVADEFTHAKARGKPAIKIMHASLAPAGMYGASHEYILFQPNAAADVLLKLMRTLALWKKSNGRPMELEIAPDVMNQRFDTSKIRACKFQLFKDYRESDWRDARIWPQPGAIYAYLPAVPDKAKLRLQIEQDNEIWQSDFSNPVGRVTLTRRQP
jgi:hypothetical protein